MKGQISIAYLGILTVISLALFGVILMWNLSIKDANTDLLAKIEMESIVEKIEADINYIESLNEHGNISVTRKIPEKIGENKYTITDKYKVVGGSKKKNKKKTIKNKKERDRSQRIKSL